MVGSYQILLLLLIEFIKDDYYNHHYYYRLCIYGKWGTVLDRIRKMHQLSKLDGLLRSFVHEIRWVRLLLLSYLYCQLLVSSVSADRLLDSKLGFVRPRFTVRKLVMRHVGSDSLSGTDQTLNISGDGWVWKIRVGLSLCLCTFEERCKWVVSRNASLGKWHWW